MPLITISHQVGSEGRRIGQMVAQKLKLPYIDREIVQGVAQRLGITEEVAESLDEHADHMVDQIFKAFSMDLAYPMDEDETNRFVDVLTYSQATQAVLDTVAKSGNAVIAGHGANFYLAKRANFLSVYIFAPLEKRIEKVMQRDKVDHNEATRMVHHNDTERCHYIKSIYKADWRDPDNYHLLINSAYTSPELASELIVKASDCCKSA
ncbi:MAG TPA: cytidylate kinase-like family protein [Chloroflexia bacterium]|nr:cytidylate kinase-like family protein [Chloroflexia bacterium]